MRVIAWLLIAILIFLPGYVGFLAVQLFQEVLLERDSYQRLATVFESYRTTTLRTTLLKVAVVFAEQDSIIERQRQQIKQLVNSRCFKRALVAGKVSIRENKGVVFTGDSAFTARR